MFKPLKVMDVELSHPLQDIEGLNHCGMQSIFTGRAILLGKIATTCDNAEVRQGPSCERFRAAQNAGFRRNESYVCGPTGLGHSLKL